MRSPKSVVIFEPGSAECHLNCYSPWTKSKTIFFSVKWLSYFLIEVITGTNLTVRPAKIIAGHEPSKTNELLQAIGRALDKKVSAQCSTKYHLQVPSSKLITNTVGLSGSSVVACFYCSLYQTRHQYCKLRRLLQVCICCLFKFSRVLYVLLSMNIPSICCMPPQFAFIVLIYLPLCFWVSQVAYSFEHFN